MKFTKKLIRFLILLILLLTSTSCSKSKKVTEFEDAYIFNEEGLASVKINGLYGFIDENLNMVIEPSYEEQGHFTDNRAVVKKNGQYGIINSDNEVIIPFEYDSIYTPYYDLFIAVKDGVFGVIDKDLNVVLPFEYDEIKNSFNGYLSISKDGKYGCVDTEGNVVVDLKYDSIEPGFITNDDHIVFITKSNLKYGYIYPAKNITVEPIYEAIRPDTYSDLILVSSENKWSLINLDNNTIVGLEFDTLPTFDYDGMGMFMKDFKYGFINSKGEVVIEPIYSDAHSFSQGLAAVEGEDGWMYINTEGKTVIPGPFLMASDFSNGVAKVLTGSEKNGVINTDGKYICEPIYRAINIDSMGSNQDIITVSYSEGTSYNTACFNIQGEKLFDSTYDSISFYSYNGLGIAKEGGKCGIINSRGIEIIPVEYTSISFLNDDLFLVCDEKMLYGVIDKNRTEIIPFKYDKIMIFNDYLLTITLNNKHGFFNLETKEIISPVYDEIINYMDDYVLVRKGDKYIYLDKYGIPLK